MQATRVVRLWSFLLCGAAAAAAPACAVVDLGEGGSAGAPPAPVTAPAESSAEAALTGCTTYSAGGGFGSQAFTSTATLAIADLEATATGSAALDAVISMSRGAPTSFNHLATSVRFSTAGVLDVRDGAAYRADASVPFTLGQVRKLRIVADVPSHTFSVYVDTGNGYGYTTRLAKRYAFRSTTQTLPSLDRLAAIVDGAAGQLSVCNPVVSSSTRVAYTREGGFSVVPLAGDVALASDGATTLRLSATGAVQNQIAVGGELAADQLGRAYLASVSGTQLSLGAYTDALAPIWSRVDAAPAGARVLAMGADAAGVTIALGAYGLPVTVLRYPAAGGAGAVLYTGGTHAAVAADGFAVANATSTAYDVSVFANDGALQWTQSYPGAIGAAIHVMTLGLGGRVVLGGRFYAATTFGGATLDYYPPPPGEPNTNTYLVGLDRATGAQLFLNRVSATQLTSAAGNGARLVVTGERVVTPIFPDLWQYDATGAQVAGQPNTGFYEQWGRSGRVAIGASNRIYWERSMMWPLPTSTPFPYLLALTP